MSRQIIGAKNIPKTSVKVDGLEFRIIGDYRKGSLEIINEDKKALIPLIKDRIGIVQLIPLENYFKIYLSSFEKPGTLLSYDFSLNNFDLKFNGKIDFSFWNHGILADRNNKGVIYGSGDDIGIKLFDLEKNTLKEIVSSDDRPKEDGLGYAFYTLFHNPPQIQDNKFYISHLDDNRDFLCHEHVFGSLIAGEIIKDLKKSMRYPELNKVLEKCIDDYMIDKGYQRELESIKKDVMKSYFLYNYEKQPWQQVIVASEEITRYLKTTHLQNA